MSKIRLNVDFLVETSIDRALLEAKELAQKLNVAYITFSFNGINFSVSPSADIEKGLKKFYKGERVIVI